MVGHWEFTYGKERVMELIKQFKGEFISKLNVGENLDKKIRAVYEIVSDYIREQKVVDISMKSNVKVLDFDCGCPTKGAKC